jgi:phosphate transport system substrate-binding protein
MRRMAPAGRWLAATGVLAAMGALLAGCGAGSPLSRTETAAARRTQTPAAQATKPASTAPAGTFDIPTDIGKDDHARLIGAGSTFANPLYTRWASDYKSGVAGGVEINYQSVGSGAGIQQLIARTVDFGASDAPMTSTEENKAGAPIQHIPTAMGAVVITYNLSGLSQPLEIDGETLAKIYLGKITKWDDPAIAAQNPGQRLPDDEIVVVHRSDGSGTSFIFTDYLSSVSQDWKSGPGTSKNPQWPVGLGGQGNEGVTQQVKQNDNSIGYVEQGYADNNHLPYADVKNASGEYVTPSSDTASKAAAGVAIPADYKVSIVNSPSRGAYPIVGFTWIILYKEQGDEAKGKALVDWLWWAIHDGQALEPSLGYAPLPEDLVRSLERTLTAEITSGGAPLLPAASG